jgi:hypothetical protein
MTTNHLKTGVESTPETSCISNTHQTMVNVQHNVSVTVSQLEELYVDTRFGCCPQLFCLCVTEDKR